MEEPREDVPCPFSPPVAQSRRQQAREPISAAQRLPLGHEQGKEERSSRPEGPKENTYAAKQPSSLIS